MDDTSKVTCIETICIQGMQRDLQEMDDTSKITSIETYLEQLTTIRPDDISSLPHPASEERLTDHILPCLCSLAIHALLFFIFSISMFRAPSPIVTSNPTNIWLIPFINSGDIFSASDSPSTVALNETLDVRANKGIQEANVPQVSIPEPEVLEDFDISAPSESADAELIVMKLPKSVIAVRTKPQHTKAVTAEVRSIRSESPPKKLITVEKENFTDPSGTPPAPATVAFSLPVAIMEPADSRTAQTVPSQHIALPPPAALSSSQLNTKSETVTSQRAAQMQQKEQAQDISTKKVIKEKTDILKKQTAQLPVSGNVNAKRTIKAAAAVHTALKPTVADTPKKTIPAKLDTQHGIMAPKTTGDIKLTITSTTAPRIAISFLDFPATKWNKPLSRNEAKRQSDIVPLVTSREGSYDFVVANTRPGIYTITAAARESMQQAKFQLVLFEGRARESKIKIGAVNVSEKFVIVKILMPDGIIWDDENAFTGNLEDSESVTKFNTETGLIWKEYK